MSLTRGIAEHVCGLQFDDLPDEAVRAAKIFSLDTLGVAAAGARAPHADDVLRVAASWGQGSDATVLGSGERLPAASAAYVNAFRAHAMEYDCVHEPAVVHPMATVFSAALAEAERRAADGRTFLTAIVAGVDVAAGLGVAAPGPLRFFRPATAGIFGAAAAVASLRRFTPDRLLSAWGLALAQASGTMQAHVEGKPALPLQIANAARGGLVACDLADAGLLGPKDAFEGPFGYLPLFEEGADLAAGFGALGKAYRICEVSHKAYPTGRAAQGGLMALERLIADGLTVSGLRSLTLSAPPLIPRLVGRPAAPDMTPAYARLCFAYLAARTLISGPVGLGDFAPARLSETAVLRLAERIRVEERSGAPFDFAPQTLTAHTDDGDRSETVHALPGSPDLPLTAEQRDAKLRACLDHAGHRADADALVRAVEALHENGDVARIISLTTGPR